MAMSSAAAACCLELSSAQLLTDLTLSLRYYYTRWSGDGWMDMVVLGRHGRDLGSLFIGLSSFSSSAGAHRQWQMGNADGVSVTRPGLTSDELQLQVS